MSDLSLVEALASVPDPRDPRGTVHPLPAILSLTVVAILAGCKSLTAISQFGRDRGVALAHALGFRRGKTPAKSCLSDLFCVLDVQALEGALARWLQDRAASAGWQAVCLDGKTVKGSADGEAPGVHLLSAFVPAASAVIAQIRVDAKTNEHKAALRLLGVLPLAGKVVTGDAMFTHRDVAREVGKGGGDYLLFVKDNQPELLAQIQSALHGDGDFSPLPTEEEGGLRAAGQVGGQGARPDGTPAASEHDDAERLPGLAGRGAGVRAGEGASGEGQGGGAGGVRDNQPCAGRGGREKAARAGAGALGDREQAALRAG